MSSTEIPTPLGAHTLKTLCDELVSGRAVRVGDEGELFMFEAADTRLVFQWYLKNRDKWSRNSTKDDAKAVADQLDGTPTELPPTPLARQGGPKRILRLSSLRAHRFAGIHAYGTPDDPPPDFDFTFDKPLVSIQGGNAAGKTSLLSAVCWCLTGRIFRSQRAPEEIEEPVIVRGQDDQDDATSFDMAAITPKPAQEVLASLGQGKLPIDTWVELSFVDESGTSAGTVRRELQRSPRGKIQEIRPNLAVLGLDPMALQVGTVMPGQLPYIQLGEACDLGLAVASLTGLRALQELAKHAAKTQKKLQKDLVDDDSLVITGLDAEYSTNRQELENLLRDHPDIAPPVSIPVPGPGKEADEALAKCVQHLTDLRTHRLADCKAILGDAFAPGDPTVERGLMADVGPALGALDPQNVSRLHSAQRLRLLAALTPKDFASADALIGQLVGEAKQLSSLAQQPGIAARVRLYVRVAGWYRDHPGVPQTLEFCPVCRTPLAGKVDEITGKLITHHIEQCLATDTSFLENTIEGWEQSALKHLRASLPEALQLEMGRDLPDKPGEFLAKALGEELLGLQCFAGSLAGLKDTVRNLCRHALIGLPHFTDPPLPGLPPSFRKGPDGLQTALGRVVRAIAFAKWRREHDTQWVRAYRLVTGNAIQPMASPQAPSPEERPRGLLDLLTTLDQIVKGAQPISQALARITALSKVLEERHKMEERFRRYERAATAMEPLLRLEHLVRNQVDPLVDKLYSATKLWKGRFYTPAFVGAPEIATADVGADGRLTIEAASDGTMASAHHLSNTSDLRATLLAFLVAFWQHILKERGGLKLLMLDDPQELFDPSNRRHMADAIPLIVDEVGSVIVSSNDFEFERRLADSAAKKIGVGRHDRRTIHTLTSLRSCIQLGEFAAEIERRRRAFESKDNENEDVPARDYVVHLRCYVENRLFDFFPTADPGLPKQPTLADLLNALRGRRRAGREPYTYRGFGMLLDWEKLAEGSRFLNLMNEAHHSAAMRITYGDVLAVKGDCVQVQSLIDVAHEEFELWMRRDVVALAAAKPEAPLPVQFPAFDVPLVAAVAAFAGDGSTGGILDVVERLKGDWLSNHAFYVINADNFGFSADRGCRAIVDISGREPEDHSLVVALYRNRTYARRLLRDSNNPGVVALESEAKNPVESRPSLLLPTQEVRLLPVVGILFSSSGNSPDPKGEAALATDTGLLESAELACEVQGDSALPLALPGQWILGGRQILPNELPGRLGDVVAIATSDEAFFKRIGHSISGAEYIRRFESIGGAGESVLVRTEVVDGTEDVFPGIPLLVSARRVIGILYEH